MRLESGASSGQRVRGRSVEVRGRWRFAGGGGNFALGTADWKLPNPSNDVLLSAGQ